MRGWERNADEFEVVDLGASFIAVIRVAEGWVYTIPVAQQFDGRRVLGAAITSRDDGATMRLDPEFANAAVAFAEREARKAGIID